MHNNREIMVEQRKLFVSYNELMQKFKDNTSVDFAELDAFARQYEELKSNEGVDCSDLPPCQAAFNQYSYQAARNQDNYQADCNRSHSTEFSDEDRQNLTVDELIIFMSSRFFSPINNLPTLIAYYQVFLGKQSTQSLDGYEDLFSYVKIEYHRDEMTIALNKQIRGFKTTWERLKSKKTLEFKDISDFNNLIEAYNDINRLEYFPYLTRENLQLFPSVEAFHDRVFAAPYPSPSPSDNYWTITESGIRVPLTPMTTASRYNGTPYEHDRLGSIAQSPSNNTPVQQRNGGTGHCPVSWLPDGGKGRSSSPVDDFFTVTGSGKRVPLTPMTTASRYNGTPYEHDRLGSIAQSPSNNTPVQQRNGGTGHLRVRWPDDDTGCPSSLASPVRKLFSVFNEEEPDVINDMDYSHDVDAQNHHKVTADASGYQHQRASSDITNHSKISGSFWLLVAASVSTLAAALVLLLIASSLTSGMAIAGWTCLGVGVLTGVGACFFASSKKSVVKQMSEEEIGHNAAEGYFDTVQEVRL